MEFAPEGVDVFLLVIEAGVFHEVVAHCGVGAVGTDHEVKRDFYFVCAVLVGFAERGFGGILGVVGFGGMGTLLEPGNVFVEVGACELVVEVKGHVGHFPKGVEEAFVETCSVDSSDELGLSAPWLVLLMEAGTDSAMYVICLGLLIEMASLVLPVDHTAMHGYRLLQDSFNESITFGISHRVDPAFRESKVDGLGKVQGGGRWVSEIFGEEELVGIRGRPELSNGGTTSAKDDACKDMQLSLVSIYIFTLNK